VLVTAVIQRKSKVEKVFCFFCSQKKAFFCEQKKQKTSSVSLAPPTGGLLA
jgi:hypothetical protein